MIEKKPEIFSNTTFSNTRDYLESRLRGEGPGSAVLLWRAVAVMLVTAALFAALHNRWAEAFVADLAFSLLARRSGQIADAVAAHALANRSSSPWPQSPATWRSLD